MEPLEFPYICTPMGTAAVMQAWIHPGSFAGRYGRLSYDLDSIMGGRAM